MHFLFFYVTQHSVTMRFVTIVCVCEVSESDNVLYIKRGEMAPVRCIGCLRE